MRTRSIPTLIFPSHRQGNPPALDSADFRPAFADLSVGGPDLSILIMAAVRLFLILCVVVGCVRGFVPLNLPRHASRPSLLSIEMAEKESAVKIDTKKYNNLGERRETDHAEEKSTRLQK